MATNAIDDINEGLECIRRMFPEDHVREVQAPRNPINAMKAAGIDLDEVRKAVGGHFDNILHAEQVDQTSWRLKVRRITPSGNYTETITVTANSDVISENTETSVNQNKPTYRLTPHEAAQEVAKALGNHLIKIEAVRGDDSLLSLHIRESQDTQGLHRIFANLNASLHQGGWHATMRENKRWTMRPMAGTFLEKRATFRDASKGEHLYHPSHYADMSTEALLQSNEVRDKAPMKEDTINESDSRKRAFKAGYPMLPQHALAQSTDTIMYPAVGDNDKFKDDTGSKESKPKKNDSKESPALRKTISVSGDFL
jgi:hypothetical protein